MLAHDPALDSRQQAVPSKNSPNSQEIQQQHTGVCCHAMVRKRLGTTASGLWRLQHVTLVAPEPIPGGHPYLECAPGIIEAALSTPEPPQQLAEPVVLRLCLWGENAAEGLAQFVAQGEQVPVHLPAACRAQHDRCNGVARSWACVNDRPPVICSKRLCVSSGV